MKRLGIVILILLSFQQIILAKEFTMLLNTTLLAPAGNTSILSFSVFNTTDVSKQLIPWNQLSTQHARKLHVVILSSDLQTVGHLHPEDFFSSTSITTPTSSTNSYFELLHDGVDPIDSPQQSTDITNSTQFSISFVFPKAGLYIISCDYAIKNHSVTQHQVFNITISGTIQTETNVSTVISLEGFKTQQLFSTLPMGQNESFVNPIALPPTPLFGADSSKIIQISSRWNYGHPIRVNTCVLLQFTMQNSSVNSPIQTLISYLEQPMHLIVVHSDLEFISHFHGFLPSFSSSMMHPMDCNSESSMMMTPLSSNTIFGPQVAAVFSFPKSGIYRLIGQVRTVDNQLLTHYWWIQVDDALSIDWLYICGFVFVGVALVGMGVIGFISAIIKCVRCAKRRKMQRQFSKVVEAV